MLRRTSLANLGALFKKSVSAPFKDEIRNVGRSIRKAKSSINLRPTRQRLHPSTAQTLPEEVLEQVFYYVQAIDKQSLLPCSLVCRSWEIPCSRLLFRQIEFRFGYPILEGPWSLWQSFQKDVSTSPRVFANLRILVLNVHVHFMAIQNLVTTVLDLRSLDLHVAFSPLEQGPEPYHPPTHRIKLELVRLRQYSGYPRHSSKSVPGLLDCLLWFVEIDDLEITFWDIEIEKAANLLLADVPEPKPMVHTLRIPVGIQLCAGVLQAALDLSAITALHIREELSAIPRLLSSALDGIGPSLTHCQFDLDSRSTCPANIIEFFACTCLHTMCLTFRPVGPLLHLDFIIRGFCALWEYYLQSIAQIPYLKTLVIDFDPGYTDTPQDQAFIPTLVRALDWVQLNTCVDRLNQLRTLTIHVPLPAASHGTITDSAETVTLITPYLSSRACSLLSILSAHEEIQH